MPSVRAATMADFDALCRLIEQVDDLHRARFPQLFRKPDGPCRARAEVERTLEGNRAMIFVAQSDQDEASSASTLAGLVWTQLRDVPDHPLLVPGRAGVIDTLVVRETHRRRGLGRLLMKHVTEWFEARGATRIELNVYDFNEEAVAFYESMGFQVRSRAMLRALRS